MKQNSVASYVFVFFYNTIISRHAILVKTFSKNFFKTMFPILYLRNMVLYVRHHLYVFAYRMVYATLF